jgi:hypothetical protein
MNLRNLGLNGECYFKESFSDAAPAFSPTASSGLSSFGSTVVFFSEGFTAFAESAAWARALLAASSFGATS